MKSEKITEHKAKGLQIKAKGSIQEELLLKLGARKITATQQIDKYFTPTGFLAYPITRVREEAGRKYITERDISHEEIATIRTSKYIMVGEEAVEKWIKERGLKYVGLVSKRRTIYHWGKLIIAIDEVDGLGNFVEMHSEISIDLPLLLGFLNVLGIEKTAIERHSYIELILAKDRRKLLAKLRAIADKVQNFAFGITSGVMTTLGIITGVWFGTKDRLAVISGILAIAAADSLSDAMGAYTEQKMHYGIDEKKAKMRALLAFISKAIISLTFVIPFVLFPVKLQNFAILIAFVWGLLIISFFAVQIAAIEYASISKKIIKQIAITLLVALLAFVGSSLVKLVK
ncbi:MAG: CYTH domain-containing protein [candidate division WOR-3 bacterium]